MKNVIGATICLVLLWFVSTPISVCAQINYYRGILSSEDIDRSSTEALNISYIIPTSRLLDIELGYRRDGHPNKLPFKMNDRDGFFVGVKRNVNLTDNLKFNLGTDAYYYYDTQSNDNYVRNFAGVLYSELELKTKYKISIIFRMEHIYANKYSIDTNAYFVGIGTDLNGDGNGVIGSNILSKFPSNDRLNFIGVFNGSGYRQSIEIGRYMKSCLKMSMYHYNQDNRSYGTSIQFGFSKLLLNDRVRLELTGGPFYSYNSHNTYLLINRSISIQIIKNIWVVSEFGRLPAHSRNSNDEDMRFVGCRLSF